MEEMYYKKVIIRTIDDLPKEECRRHVTLKTGRIDTWLYMGGDDNEERHEMVDFYLQPCPPQLREVTDEEIEQWANEEYSEGYRGNERYYGFQKGAKRMREQMKGGTK
jgi:hypothetical protein